MGHKLSTGHRGKKSGTTLIGKTKEAASRGTGSMEGEQSGTTPIDHKKEAASRDTGSVEVEQSGATPIGRKKEAASRGTGSMEGEQSGTAPIGHRKEAASRGTGSVEQSSSSAAGRIPTTTPLPVPPSGNIDPYRTSTKRPAPDSPKRIQLDMSMTWLGDLAVEAVFPAAGFIRMEDRWVSSNEVVMRELRDGEILRGEREWGLLIAGSTAEGVAVEPRWGHPEADTDNMDLYGGDLAVGVDGPGEQPPGGVTLRYRGEGCPPAYTRLEVVDPDRLVAHINRHPDHNEEVPGHTCVAEEGGRQWLLSRRLLDAMRLTVFPTVQGPAASEPGSLLEVVTALVATGPHPDMPAYIARPRTDWPSLTQLQDLLTLPFLVVCVGPKDHPDSGRLFRASWSPHEMTLFMAMVPWAKQGYICFKQVIKALLAPSDNDDIDSGNHDIDNTKDGRSRVGSYHLKTVFLRYLEEHPPQPEGSPFQLALELCRNLKQCLVNGNIPHYFLPACNLLEKVGEAERQEALSAVDEVLNDPIAAIIGSPSRPGQIFGSRHSKADLLRCFRAVSDQPACGVAREDLQRLIRDLDEHREGRYGEQLEEDEEEDKRNYIVSGRPGLARLAGYLQHTPV